MRTLLLLSLILVGLNPLLAQKAKLSGIVTDSIGKRPIADVVISVEGENIMTLSNSKGEYTIEVPSGRKLRMVFAYIGKGTVQEVGPFETGSGHELNVKLGFQLKEHVVIYEKDRQVIVIDPKKSMKMAMPNRGLESVLKLLPGVTSNNELSSTYNVRGGNYDENLIYVNDIEIYRPQLIRSGQQEGLSFINPDLISSVRFSAGGFEAKYGDKMSSVLDITYLRADSTDIGGNLSFMGAQLYAAGRKGSRFHYLIGSRYRSNQYLLGSLDVQGNYKPRFADIQAYLTYELSTKWQLSWLGSFAQNRYLFYPESQTTSFGTVQTALQLTVFFNGAELMQYNTVMNGLTLKYQPNDSFNIRIIGSNFYSVEQEFFTTEGAYRLDELDKDLGSETFGQAKFNRGYGYFINHARNEFEALVYNTAIKGDLARKYHDFSFGAQVQYESIHDVLNEWVYNDSADYSVPYNFGDSLFLFSVINGKNTLSSSRFTAYIQDSWLLNPEYNLRLNAGIRTNYWTLNKQNVISPRAQVSFEPNRRYNRDTATRKAKADIMLKAAFGYYYQPPFYRELRTLGGIVNPEVRAQKSIHYVVGGDWNFSLWDRRFKLFAEAYYKHLSDLVPYQFENVRIRYYANNNSRGYSTGLDTRINGEFIKGLESWFSFSVMQTKERITYNDAAGNTVESGWLRRPTDQRTNIGVFFQDELPKWPQYKVHLNFIYGSNLPYYLGGAARYVSNFKVPPYRRVDIGFSREIVGEDGFKNIKLNRYFKMLWVSVEVFNLFQINNTVSYIWVRDINSDIYGVPNYLTSRRINLNLLFKF